MAAVRGLSRILVAAMAASGLQILALFLLDAEEFGKFTLLYIPLSIGNAAALAVVCEPWARGSTARSDLSNVYLSFLALIAACAGLLALPIGLLIGNSLAGVAVGIAVGANVYRSGARYLAVLEGNRRRASLPDSISVITLAASVSIYITYSTPSLLGISWIWGASSMMGACFSLWPKAWVRPRQIRDWVTSRWASIKPLLWDSALTEVGTVLAPATQAPLMGISEYGVLRAISSITAPIRMLLNPLRPNLARLQMSTVTSSRGLTTFTAGMIAISVAALGGLIGIQHLEALRGSAVADLAEYTLPAAAFIAIYAATITAYYLLRTHARGRDIVVYRVVQSVLFIAMPIIGYLLGGLAGAIWARCCSSAVSLVMSATILRGLRSTR